MKLLPRLYYEKLTGNYICITNQQSWIKEIPTKEHDMVVYDALKSLNTGAVDYIQLGWNYAPYEHEFLTGHCTGIHLETREPIFKYTEEEQEQLQEIKTREQLTNDMKSMQQQVSALGKVIVQSKLKEGEPA
ncbi:MAG: hypothetical protein N4A63_08550 [Vallitalea sp.]|jgi:hypothetical protein|nr:hypothetical protein [Vallitalea sp.]